MIVDHLIAIEADRDFPAWSARMNAEFPPPPIREIADAFFACLDAHPEFVDLMRAPMPGLGVRYTPGQECAVREALEAAHVHGDTRFGRLSFRFHDVLPFGWRGLATSTSKQHVRIDLDAHLDPDTLRRVVLHELGHARDFFRGVVFAHDEMELRAEAFDVAVSLIAGWGLSTRDRGPHRQDEGVSNDGAERRINHHDAGSRARIILDEPGADPHRGERGREHEPMCDDVS
jgi:hypothetical protein